MKKSLLILLIAVFVCSCAPYRQVVSIGDFSKHTNNGFTISTSTDGFKYQALGVVGIEFYPGYVQGYKKSVSTGSDPLYSSPSDDKYFHPDWNYRLDELVRVAQELGANGILDLKMTSVPATKHVEFHYYVSGMAVVVTE